MMAAVEKIFPQTRLFGSYFHLREAVEYQVKVRGIQKTTNDYVELRWAIDCFLALCFVPIEFLEDVVKSFITNLFSKTLPLEESVQEFFAHLLCTYLSEFETGREIQAQGPTFKVTIWNCVENLMKDIPITNYGMYSAYDVQQFCRQNVYRTIEALKR